MNMNAVRESLYGDATKNFYALLKFKENFTPLH